MDNTIYDEIIYLNQSYWTICKYIEATYDIDKIMLYNFLIQTYKINGRFYIFDKLCEKFQIPLIERSNFLDIMRTISINPKIKVFPYFIPLISELLNMSVKIGIITNGNVIQQKNKVNNIDWQGKLEEIFIMYANSYVPKPDPSSFLELKRNLKFESSIYIGDSKIDHEFALNSGIDFLNVKNINTIYIEK